MISLYEKFRKKLISMELKPGDKLSENSISIGEGIGRPQVREALTRLSDEGFLDTLPQRGSVVTRLKKDMIREATHAHLALEQSILIELVNKRKSGVEFKTINDYINMIQAIKKPRDEYEMVMAEWGFYYSLAKECEKEYAYSFLKKIDGDIYRLSSLKYSTYNYNANNSALNAWENTVFEIKLMAEQLNGCQMDLLLMLCSNRYNGLLVNSDALSGIYGEYFE